MATFAERLKAIRIQSGVQQKAVAEMLGVTPRTVGRYEFGDREPTIENIKKLATFFNVTTDYLLGLSDDPN